MEEYVLDVLVTGGAGFIGSNLIRHLLRFHPSMRITNLDKLTYAGNLANLVDVKSDPRYRFVRGDIADAELVNQLVGQYRFAAIVNVAAESHVDRSIADAEDFVRTNVQGVSVLLEAARRFGVSRFVQVSTDEVYGTLSGREKFSELSPLAPNNPYAATKAGGDLLIRSYVRTYGLPAMITRCSNNYGPYQHPEKLIPKAVTSALQGQRLPVYGDGKNIRDWIHVTDHCRALDLVLHQGVPGEVYNIGADNEVANITLVKEILDIMGLSHDLITFTADRPGHDWRYGMDATRIRRRLGWKPQVSWEDGLRQTIQWYTDNRHWWQKTFDSDNWWRDCL